MKKALPLFFFIFCFSANFNSSASGVCSSFQFSKKSNSHFSLYIYKGIDFRISKQGKLNYSIEPKKWNREITVSVPKVSGWNREMTV